MMLLDDTFQPPAVSVRNIRLAIAVLCLSAAAVTFAAPSFSQSPQAPQTSPRAPQASPNLGLPESKYLEEKIDRLEKLLTEKIERSDKFLTDKTDKSERLLTERIDRSDKSLTDKTDKSEKYLTDKIDSVNQRSGLLLGIMVFVFGAISLILLITARIAEQNRAKAEQIAEQNRVKAEERAKEAEVRAKEAHLQTTHTVNLVNETLALAKIATDRANDLLTGRAGEVAGGLREDAKKLLDDSVDGRDLIVVPKRSKLLGLASKIQNYEFTLDLFKLGEKVAPECQFIRAIQLHLNQQFDEAIDQWKTVTTNDETKDSLKTLAYYWIGVEYNNIGKFSSAVKSFESGQKFADSSRTLELSRIELEARFFGNLWEESIVDKDKPITDKQFLERDDLIRRADEKFKALAESRKGLYNILTTYGNFFVRSWS